ncbi:MAG: indole-3-glycerol phosphate synthase TrpC [Lachnospiraceae bacterium]|nr:indole-3-glycerol phosphate synthase TrpC [Lachnospiraceae bacterium]
MTILDEIAAYAKIRVKEAKKIESLESVKNRAYQMPKGDFEFEKALKKEGLSFICECKKASPSKGVIAEHFPYVEIAKQYEEAGADCISVLTEPKWFLGSLDYLKEISENVNIPLLRKDFTVDEYMIYEAKINGASAVLLIVSILSEDQIREYLKICDDLGMSAIVETHDKEEAETAVRAGARIIGVNNRNLKDFSVDNSLAANLRKNVPDDIIFVSESGIKDGNDTRLAYDSGADAVLVGETLMRAQDKNKMLKSLKEMRV